MGPVVDLDLVWERDLVFHGRTGALEITLDGNGREAVSPVQTLAFALASCMASDLVLILTRGRQPLEGLVRGCTRSARRRTRPLGVEPAFERPSRPTRSAAIELSRNTYCSVCTPASRHPRW
jgi:uncharacterized OsmC-like protein